MMASSVNIFEYFARDFVLSLSPVLREDFDIN